MNINRENLQKCKSILVCGMVLVTSVAFNGCTLNREASKDNSSIEMRSSVDSRIVDSLLIAKTDADMFLLFCPENRGLCVNYETEEFVFMYRSSEDLSNKLKEYFGIDVEIEKLKPYLIEKHGYKESYSYNEIFVVFESIKNNNQTLIKN